MNVGYELLEGRIAQVTAQPVFEVLNAPSQQDTAGFVEQRSPYGALGAKKVLQRSNSNALRPALDQSVVLADNGYVPSDAGKVNVAVVDPSEDRHQPLDLFQVAVECPAKHRCAEFEQIAQWLSIQTHRMQRCDARRMSDHRRRM